MSKGFGNVIATSRHKKIKGPKNNGKQRTSYDASADSFKPKSAGIHFGGNFNGKVKK